MSSQTSSELGGKLPNLRSDESRNRQRSSRRSTRANAKLENCESARLTSGKRNIVERDVANGRKIEKLVVEMSDSKKTTKKSQVKLDIAARAKSKFQDNLLRFQKGTKTASTSSSFQRSFRKDVPKDKEEQVVSNFRRSYRKPPTARVPENPGHVFRHSLRKERITDSIAKFERQGNTPTTSSLHVRSKVGLKHSTAVSKESTHENTNRKNRETSERTLSKNENAGPVEKRSRATSSTPSTAESTTLNFGESNGTSNRRTERRTSRAEIAMEKHMERMRKPSVTTSLPNKHAAVIPKSRQRCSENADISLDVANPNQSTTGVVNVKTRQQSGSRKHKEDISPNGQKHTDSLGSVISFKSPTIESVALIEDDVFVSSKIVSNDHSAYPQTSTTSPIDESVPLPEPHRSDEVLQRYSIDESPAPEASKISEPECFIIPFEDKEQHSVPGTDKAANQPVKQSQSLHDTHKTPPADSKKVELIGQERLAKRSPLKSTEILFKPAAFSEDSLMTPTRGKVLKREHSTELSSSLKTANECNDKNHVNGEADTNYSVDNAIDKFRRLSEEIETVKSQGFRKSLAESNRRSAATTERIETTTLPRSQITSSSELTPAPENVVEVELPECLQLPICSNRNNEGETGSSLTTGKTSQQGEKKEEKVREKSDLIAVSTNKEKAFVTKQTSQDILSKGDTSFSTACKVVAIQQDSELIEDINEKQAATDSSYKPESFTIEADVFVTNCNHISNKSSVVNTEPEEMSLVAKPPISAEGGKTKFQQLTAAQRKEKLKLAVLKYRAEVSSDSESLISEGDSDESDIDMAWLDDGDSDASSSSSSKGRSKKSAMLERVTSSRKNAGSSSGSSKSSVTSITPTSENASYNSLVAEDSAKVGNMKAMWETKSEEKRKWAQSSSPTRELQDIRGKVGDVKAAWGSSTVSESTSEGEPLTTNENGSSTTELSSETPAVDSTSVGSMRSMWESKKQKKLNAYDANKDEAFDTNTMGRLQGAKALFENMAKKNGKQSQSPRRNINLDLPMKSESTSVSEVKGVFETKARSPVVTPLRTPTKNALKSEEKEEIEASAKETSKKTKKATENGNWSDGFESEGSLSDVPTLSSSSSSEDETSEPQLDNVRAMWKQKSVKKVYEPADAPRKMSLQELVASDAGNEISTDVPEAASVWEEKSPDSSVEDTSTRIIENNLTSADLSSKTVRKVSNTKSNIQRKISASRKKRDQRSMTQPITDEDVTTATERIQGQRAASPLANENEERKDCEDEEKILSFSERLNFFNQLLTKAPAGPQRTRSRSSLKRYQTQPVDKETIQEAQKRLQENNNFKHSSTQSALAPKNEVQSCIAVEGSFQETIKSRLLENDSKKPEETILLNQTAETANEVDIISTTKSDKENQNLASLSSLESSDGESANPLVNISDQTAHSEKHIQESLRTSFLEESENSSGDSEMGKGRDEEIKVTGSIQDRLKLLNQNQEEGWKKKVKGEQKSVRSTLEDRMNKLQENEQNWKKNTPNDSKNVRSSVATKVNISDRLNSILSNSETWKSKARAQNDASQFTVHGKIAKREGQKMVPILPSPSMKRRVLPVSATEESAVTIDDVKSDAAGLNKLSEVLKLSQKGLEPEVIKVTEETITEIPDLVDEDFENFFGANSYMKDEVANQSSDEEQSTTQETPAWLENEDTDHLVANLILSDIGRLKASVQRNSFRNKSSNRNPVKALAARSDVKQSYTEQRSNVTKLEQQRLASRFGHGSHFTSAALAGLAHKADFSKVNLRNTKKEPAFSASDLQPWKNKMLLRVKGRRRVQTRLVEPATKSLNGGDAFLLILPDKLFAWFGEFSNVIEKAKVQEIADYIIHKGDLGSKANSLTTILEETSSSIKTKEFWTHLGGRGEYSPFGGTEEDETYETNAEATVKTYKLEDSKLLPYQPSWGKLPTMGQLSSNDTYVFDFGSEMYIWQGKEVSFDDRQLAVKLARALWDQGFDYSDLGFCPFASTHESGNNLKGPRPEWGLFARVNENLETALVQEKFEDWSNIAREIGERDELEKETSRGEVASEMKLKTSIQPDMTACDVHIMRKNRPEPLPLVLEGNDIRKGHGLVYDEDGRVLQVSTNSVCVWHAADKCMELVEDENKGVFYRCGTYVVRWRYVVSSTGKWSAEEAKTSEDTESVPNGKERTAYFMWTGRDSKITDKGASALMATELDKEEGTQIVVIEGREPLAMSQCFGSGMMVVDGKKGSREGFYSWKLFCVRGTCEEDASIHQVPCEVASLRSRSSFVSLNARYAKVVVWHGCKAPMTSRSLAEYTANLLKENKKPCLGFRPTCKSVSLQICEEGKESDDFLEAFGRVRRNRYMSLLEVDSKLEFTDLPRAWHFQACGEEFVAQEFHPMVKTIKEENRKVTCFPFVQEQIDELTKPALVLLESCEGVYLWQGIAPKDLKGSSKRQIDINKRLAMETAVNFCKEHRLDCIPLLIQEQHEPMEFTNSFPAWRRQDITKISYEEKKANKPTPVADVLDTISKLTYSLEELRASPLPDGVDPNHLETYLSAKDFVDLFEMSKEDFYDLPPWKQQNLRKEKNLF